MERMLQRQYIVNTMKQRNFYDVINIRDIHHSELRSILNSIVSRGGRIVNVDSHPRETWVIVEYNEEEIKEIESLRSKIASTWNREASKAL